MAEQVESRVLLYDEECCFCRWSLAKILAWDRARRLRPVAIQSAEGERLLSDLPRPQRLASWHLVAGGRRASAGAAAVPLLRLLPGGRPVAGILARFPRATERAYRWVVRNRGRIGRLIPARARRRADARIRRRSRGG